MENAIVKTHDFEVAKQNIKNFNDNLPTSIYFDNVKNDGGLFGLGNHKVTGTEMNKLIADLQKEFSEFNDGMRGVFGQFTEIYKAFEALDEDYIKGILAAIGAASKSSEQAKAASSKANKACGDISKTITALSATVEKLKTLKSDISALQTSQANLSNSIEKAKSAYGEASKLFSEASKKISELSVAVEKLQTLKSDISALQTSQGNLFKSIEKANSDYNEANKLFLDASGKISELSKAVVNLKQLGGKVSSLESVQTQTQSRISGIVSKLGEESKSIRETIDKNLSLLKQDVTASYTHQIDGLRASVFSKKNKLWRGAFATCAIFAFVLSLINLLFLTGVL